MASTPEFELKIVVDKERSRVVVAEADSGFVSHLFYFLTITLSGLAMSFRNAKSEAVTVGCFTTLYESVMNLDNHHFCSKDCKDVLLSFACSFKPTIVTEKSKFVITEDLQVLPHVAGGFIGLLSKLGIEDMNVLQERTVKFDLSQVARIFLWSLVSTTPLTDLLVPEREFPAGRFTPRDLPLYKKHSLDQDQEVSNKMIVNVILKRSNKEVLYVEAHADFIDFLVNFLTIPFIEMLHILDGQSCLGSIDSFYKSVLSLDSQYFTSENHKTNLLRPNLDFEFQCENHGNVFLDRVIRAIVSPKFPKVESRVGTDDLVGFVRGSDMFMVTDSLVVTPFSPGSVISVMNEKKCSLGELEERRVSIGISEGLSILIASFTSTSAFTNGLFHTLNLKEPKQEV